MKLATCVFEGKIFSGIIFGNSIVPFSQFFGKDYSMLEFLRFQDEDILNRINKKINNLSGISLDKVKLLSPIPYPFRNIICLGKNYLDHVQEMSEFTGFASDSEKPVYFTKSAYPAVEPDGDVLSHSDITSQLDYEVEIAVIIGKKTENISEEDAYAHIFGFTLLNDISARDVQKSHTQWFRGKSLDRNCPVGPWIVTIDEFELPLEIDISCYVNGELRQSSNTRNMIFKIPTVISQLSEGMCLYPGDIISTGTPKGVGQGFNPPRYLKPGDVVECVSEKIGTLRNTII